MGLNVIPLLSSVNSSLSVLPTVDSFPFFNEKSISTELLLANAKSSYVTEKIKQRLPKKEKIENSNRVGLVRLVYLPRVFLQA